MGVCVCLCYLAVAESPKRRTPSVNASRSSGWPWCKISDACEPRDRFPPLRLGSPAPLCHEWGCDVSKGWGKLVRLRGRVVSGDPWGSAPPYRDDGESVVARLRPCGCMLVVVVVSSGEGGGWRLQLRTEVFFSHGRSAMVRVLVAKPAGSFARTLHTATVHVASV